MGAQEEAAKLKAQGNKCFASHEWLDAIDYYTKAIDLYDQDPSYYCNRAQVNFPLANFSENRILTRMFAGQYQT